jgi:hypothetical protein
MFYPGQPPNDRPIDPRQFPPQPEPGWSPPPAGYQPPPAHQPPPGYQQAFGQPVAPGYGAGPKPPAKPANVKLGFVIIGAVALLGLLCVGGVVAAATGDSGKSPAAPLPSAVATTTSATTPATEAATAPTTDAAAPTAAAPTAEATTAPPKPRTVKVPDLRGENAAVAQDTLEQLGFTNITFGSADKDDTWVVLPQNWTVKKQSAAPGKKLALDTLLVLTCTKQ